MNYAQQFVQGIEYRSHFDTGFKLSTDAQSTLERTFVETAEKAMEEPFFSIRQGICSLARDYAEQYNGEPYAYQCLADSHTFLNACLEQKILDERYMTLTVGDVSINGERLFNTTRNRIEQAIEFGISTVDTPRFHVWLTLVDMTVIDLTIGRHLAALGEVDSPIDADQQLSVWRPGQANGHAYHPILIDDEFLSRLQRRPH